MHPSVTFGDTSPCRGGFTNGCFPQRLPWKGSCRRMPTEGCGTLRGVSPCQAAMPAIGPDRGRSALRCSHGGPCGHPAKDIGKDCAAMHPSVTFGDTSPCRGGFTNGCRSEGHPCKRLRSRAPPQRLPWKGSCRRMPTEGCRTLPRLYPCGLAGVCCIRRGRSPALTPALRAGEPPKRHLRAAVPASSRGTLRLKGGFVPSVPYAGS